MKVVERIAKSLGFTRANKAVPGAAPEFGSSSGGILMTGSRSPQFAAADALTQFKSTAYNCASRNAVGRASSRLRLYAVKPATEDLPKIAPVRRMKMLEQEGVIRHAVKSVQPSTIAAWSSGEIIEVLDHPFLDLIQRVNPFRNQFDFMEETSTFEDCTGNAYWYIVTGTGVLKGIPVELWLLPSQYVTIVPDKNQFIKGYLYGASGFGVSGKSVALLPNEVIHFRRPNLRDQFYGMGRIEAAFSEITSNNAITQLELDRANTRGVQDLWLQLKGGDLTETQKQDIAFEFVNSFASGSRDPRPLITGQEVDAKLIAWSPKDLIGSASRGFNQQIIINAFGQSTALWNDTANRATAEAAIYSWAKFEIDPANMRTAQKINEQLLQMYDSNLTLFVAFEPQAQEDKAFVLSQETADRVGNVRTINEIRQARGMVPLQDPRADDAFATTAAPVNGGMSALGGSEDTTM